MDNDLGFYPDPPQAKDSFTFAQARRLTCDRCMRDFCYLNVFKKSFGRITQGQSIATYIHAPVHQKNQGEVRCPFCSRYQTWMVKRSFKRRALSGVTQVLVVIFISLSILFVLVGSEFRADVRTTYWTLLALMIFASLGIFFSMSATLSSKALKGPTDRFVLKDEELAVLIEKSQATGLDFTREWGKKVCGQSERLDYVIPFCDQGRR